MSERNLSTVLREMSHLVLVGNTSNDAWEVVLEAADELDRLNAIASYHMRTLDGHVVTDMETELWYITLKLAVLCHTPWEIGDIAKMYFSREAAEAQVAKEVAEAAKEASG